MRSLGFTLLAFGLLSLFVGASISDAPVKPRVNNASVQTMRRVVRGKQIFALRCAVCHGDTGGGLAEARLAFPEDHRRCESCHKPGNPGLKAEMLGSFETVRGRVPVGNAFSIGVAPPLQGEGALKAFGDAAALQAFIRAAMPRHAPGSLSNEQSRALSAFLLELNRAP